MLCAPAFICRDRPFSDARTRAPQLAATSFVRSLAQDALAQELKLMGSRAERVRAYRGGVRGAVGGSEGSRGLGMDF